MPIPQLASPPATQPVPPMLETTFSHTAPASFDIAYCVDLYGTPIGQYVNLMIRMASAFSRLGWSMFNETMLGYSARTHEKSQN